MTRPYPFDVDWRELPPEDVCKRIKAVCEEIDKREPQLPYGKKV